MTTLIAEDLLLLVLDDVKGTLTTAYPRTALGGAVLIELALAEAVAVEEKRGLALDQSPGDRPGAGGPTGTTR